MLIDDQAYEVQHTIMRLPEVSLSAIHYRPNKEIYRGTALFIPGIGGSVLFSDALLRKIAKNGIHVFGLNHRGHSGSIDPFSPKTTIEDIISAAHNVIERAEHKEKSISLIGYCAGATLAAHAADAIPAHSLVALQTYAGKQHLQKNVRRVLDSDIYLAMAVKAGKILGTAKLSCDKPFAALKTLRDFTLPKEVTTPTLTAHSNSDRRYGFDNTEEGKLRLKAYDDAISNSFRNREDASTRLAGLTHFLNKSPKEHAVYVPEKGKSGIAKTIADFIARERQ